jgi:small subunit ribosomal protein S20
MPIIKSALKRMRQTVKRRARNLTHKRDLRSALKAFTADKAAESLNKAQSELDKAVKKNLMSKHAAARKKSQLAKIAKESGAKHATKKVAAPKKTATKKTAVKKTTAKKSTTK